MKNTESLKNNESGLVAIVVTLVLMIVMSLIVLGFAQSTRRNQRATLDRQLSSQAFYTAESGVNVAQEKIQNIIESSPTPDLVKQDCGWNSDYPQADFDLGEGNQVTCVLTTDRLNNLIYQKVGTQSVVGKIKNESTANLSSVTFQWRSSNPNINGSCSVGTSLPANSSWPSNCQPMLRVDMVRLGNESSLSPAAMYNEQFTAFFRPSGAGGVAFSNAQGNNMGNIYGANCSGSPTMCTMRIDGVDSRSIGFRILSLYGSSDVTITANSGTATLIEGQVMIDSTARSQDILRRIQVRVSPTLGDVPDFALATRDGFCKRYEITESPISAQPATGSPSPLCNL